MKQQNGDANVMLMSEERLWFDTFRLRPDKNVPAGVTRTGKSFSPLRGPPEGDGGNFYPRCLCHVRASEGAGQIPDRSFGVSG